MAIVDYDQDYLYLYIANSYDLDMKNYILGENRDDKLLAIFCTDYVPGSQWSPAKHHDEFVVSIVHDTSSNRIVFRCGYEEFLTLMPLQGREDVSEEDVDFLKNNFGKEERFFILSGRFSARIV